MPPHPRGLRRLIPIHELHGTIQFRWATIDNTKPPKPTGTKWASCEMGSMTETKPTEFGVIGMNSAGHPTYGEVKAVTTNFSSPCPLGTPPKPPDVNTSPIPTVPSAPPIPTIPDMTPI